jgi:type III restriction enzyme
MKKALKTDDVTLPEGFAAQAGQINAILKKIAGGLNVKNNDDSAPCA